IKEWAYPIALALNTGSASFLFTRCCRTRARSSQPGPKCRNRTSIGGWGAKSACHHIFTTLAKHIWLTSSAYWLVKVEGVPLRILINAPAEPLGLRVNCTEEAAANISRCRLTADLIKLPNTGPA